MSKFANFPKNWAVKHDGGSTFQDEVLKFLSEEFHGYEGIYYGILDGYIECWTEDIELSSEGVTLLTFDEFFELKYSSKDEIIPSFGIEDRIVICKDPKKIPWFKSRIFHGYCHLEEGMTGTIMGFTIKGDKVAVQFDDIVWTLKSNGQSSSFDGGCHGKGRKGYSAYFPLEYLTRIEDPKSNDISELISDGVKIHEQMHARILSIKDTDENTDEDLLLSYTH